MLRHTAVAGFWTHDGERVRGAALHKDEQDGGLPTIWAAARLLARAECAGPDGGG